MTDVTVAITPQPSIVVQVGDVSSVSLLYTGNVAQSMTAGETLAYGDICYVKAADGRLYKAKANGTAVEADAQFICIVAAGIATGSAGLFSGCGFVPSMPGSPGTRNARAYLSSTYGGTTTTAPVYGTDITYYTTIVGRWVSTSLLYFCPSPSATPAFNG